MQFIKLQYMQYVRPSNHGSLQAVQFRKKTGNLATLVMCCHLEMMVITIWRKRSILCCIKFRVESLRSFTFISLAFFFTSHVQYAFLCIKANGKQFKSSVAECTNAWQCSRKELWNLTFFT